MVSVLFVYAHSSVTQHFTSLSYAARIMQHEQSTSAPAADPHATSIGQRTTEQIRTAISALKQRINEQFLAANVAFLAQLQAPTTAPATTCHSQSIPPAVTPTTEGCKAAPEPPIDLLDDEPKPTASEFADFTYYGEVIHAGLERPPRDVEEPRLLTLIDDTTRTLSDKKTHAAYDEYLHIGGYVFFETCANAGLDEGLDALSNGSPL
jgi:hypothetical protein